jgi:predicted RecB family nuclease
VVRSGREFVAADLATALATLGPPTAYLDFETISPAVPLYPGTRPYQRIPFQWSLHEMDATGGVRHREFLADGRRDPRRDFVERLLEPVDGGAYPVVVYLTYEDGVLAELALALPELAARIDALRARLVDLLPVVRQRVHHPAFSGSFSLKAVAPALARGFGYGDLDEIGEGRAASAAFLRMASGPVSDAEEETRVRAALLTYCERDTRALVELHRALRERLA